MAYEFEGYTLDQRAELVTKVRILQRNGITTRAQLRAWVQSVTGAQRMQRAWMMAGIKFPGEETEQIDNETDE